MEFLIMLFYLFAISALDYLFRYVLFKAISNANRFVSCKNIFEAKVSVYLEKRYQYCKAIGFLKFASYKGIIS